MLKQQMAVVENKQLSLFFVYGTLKEGGGFANRFDDVRINNKQAVLNGFDLFNLGYFPGIVAGSGVVVGELHEYEAANEVRRAFDSIEGYNPSSPGTSLFKRIIATVTTEDYEQLDAYVYVYNSRISKGMEKIVSGIWQNKNS